MLALVHLSLIFAGFETAHLFLSFLPPGWTAVACGTSVLRSLGARAVPPYRA